ncbi:MAG TPA: diacylglycerol kinase family lipid kinase [Firmicutes bacterium]|nr:diacylglycerol kinase family lipid kinase [Bacillota bacterium]HHT41775.1 diacylglycerol kinase family lipid kinase [Bacillota bacterium]
MSIAIIANPLAGRGRGQKVAQAVQELLTNQNIDFEMIFSKYAGHAVELAEQASRKHRIVAALGGDGTAREVLAAVWQTSSAFGVIPGGTGNDYARGLGIPRDIPEALKVLLAGATAPFDVGVEQDRVFGQLACIGFPVDVIIHVNEHRDGLIKGSAAFLAGVAATIRSLRTYPVRITVDGKTFEKDVVGVFVMNMPYCGGGMQFVPEARYDSGVFHVLIIDRISRLDLAVTLPKIYSGKHVSHPAVSIVTGREVSIEGRSLPVMLDGDIFSARPLHAKILPQAAQVVVPKAPA